MGQTAGKHLSHNQFYLAAWHDSIYLGPVQESESHDQPMAEINIRHK